MAKGIIELMENMPSMDRSQQLAKAAQAVNETLRDDLKADVMERISTVSTVLSVVLLEARKNHVHTAEEAAALNHVVSKLSWLFEMAAEGSSPVDIAKQNGGKIDGLEVREFPEFKPHDEEENNNG